MEFLPLKRHSASEKQKKPHTGLKSKSDAGGSKKSKKSRDYKLEILSGSRAVDIDLENKSVVDPVTNQILDCQKKITATNEKVPTNRLFVNMKRVIMNEEMVKEIHQDIIAVRFPRKKRSRWCWAIFHDEKKAAKAYAKLKRRGDIIVTKPRERPKVILKNIIRPPDSKRKKAMKSKIKEAWM